MTDLKNALLAVLMALGGQSQPSTLPPDPGPAALVAEHRPLTSRMVLGAWRGSRVVAGEQAPSPVEVVFVDGLRPATVLGYFTFGEGAEAATMRRLGRLSADRLVFTLPEGRELTLRLDERQAHLLGREAGAGPASTIELSRLRARAR